jgi:hypothetical protein
VKLFGPDYDVLAQKLDVRAAFLQFLSGTRQQRLNRGAVPEFPENLGSQSPRLRDRVTQSTD